MTRYARSTAVGKVGVLEVMGALTREMVYAREVHTEDDCGIDLLVEPTEAGQATGIMAGVQVKSGASYLGARPGNGQAGY
ncbi:MAG: DUF4365 domain-containing protein [Armatimonadetes bacterium]|nr:DUF4365 domain-containing protein [Armatimonadota bacterium]